MSIVSAIVLFAVIWFMVLFIVLIVSMILTAPEFELWILLPVNVGVTLVMTTWFMPISKTLWTSFDIMMRPLRPDEVDWMPTQGNVANSTARSSAETTRVSEDSRPTKPSRPITTTATSTCRRDIERSRRSALFERARPGCDRRAPGSGPGTEHRRQLR